MKKLVAIAAALILLALGIWKAEVSVPDSGTMSQEKRGDIVIQRVEFRNGSSYEFWSRTARGLEETGPLEEVRIQDGNFFFYPETTRIFQIRGDKITRTACRKLSGCGPPESIQQLPATPKRLLEKGRGTIGR